MNSHEPFFIVEDSLNQKLDDIAPLIHDELSKSDYLEHFDLGKIFKSKSKYKGGFKKGKNTKEYNHDYYIHNKDKWKKDGETEEMTLDELKELGLTDEQIEELQLEKNSEGVFIVPTEWASNFLKGGLGLLGGFIDSLKNLLVPSKPTITINPEDNKDDEPKSIFDLIPPKKTDGYEDPKTLDDPQRITDYEIEVEDPSGRSSETITTNFEVIDWLKGAKVKQEPSSVKEDCAAVNPNYGESVEYSVNCAWCTTAYDLRRRGYDVQAPGVQDGLTLIDESQFYKDTTIEDWTMSSSAKNLFESLEKEGNGARGRLTVTWGNTSNGHSMAWEVVDGKAYVIDCQVNKTYSYEEFVDDMGGSIYWDNTSSGSKYGKSYDIFTAPCVWLRTDNRELNTSGVLHEDDDHVVYWRNETHSWNEETNKFENRGYVMDPGSYTDVNLSEMFISYPVDEYSTEQWNMISSKLKNRRIKSKSKKYKKRASQ